MPNTQTVTVLFTDIVGSTELSSHLGPDEADRVRQSHFSLLRQALAAGEGSEVKNLGDGIMAVFGSPSGAVSCAVAMQQAIEQGNRRSPQPIGLRVGMSCGETTVEDGDYFGDPVVEAARICALCRGGQILAAESVRTMAGRRCAHPFDMIGERDLKGLPDPVTLYEVAWAPATTTARIPLPDRLETTSASLFGFFGRQPEKERLVEGMKGAAEGTRLVVLLSGEPGIGKTSLCKEVARAAYDLNMPVLYGRCDEDLVVSYQPFAEALAHLVVHVEDSLLAKHVADSAGSLQTMVPALAKRLPELPQVQSADPDSERLRLFAAVVNLLSLASSDGGLLLVLDDLHWADKASLQLLRHVASSTQVHNVMVIGTYRASDLHAGSPLSDTLASLRREASADRIDLAGLEDFEIIEMMERFAGHEMAQDGVDLAHAVRQETEGNPFFTTELLRHLGESGLVYQNETGRWVASDDLYERGLPQSVREVVGQRVDRLGEVMRRVLSLAAVIGREFDIEVLAAVADIDEDMVLDLVDRGIEAGLLSEVEGSADRLSFAHALTQHILYEDLGASRRTRAHRKVAQVLEQLYGDAPEARAAELARHFVAATKTADALKALTYCKLAGDHALAQVAPADALGWFAQAIDLYSQISPDEGLRCDLLIGLGTAQRSVGDPAYRQTLLDAAAIAQALGDDDRLVAAALANYRGSGGASAAGHVDVERVAVLEAAVNAVGPADSSERAMLLTLLGTELTYAADRQRSSTLRSEALAMARRGDDPLCFLNVTAIVHTDWSPQTLDERLSDLSRAVTLAESLGDPLAALHANRVRAIACLQAADRSGFDAHVETMAVMAERIEDNHALWAAMIMQTQRALLEGDLDQARRDAEATWAIGATAAPEAAGLYATHLVELQRIQGRWVELAEAAKLMAAHFAEFPGLSILRASLARVYCDLNRVDEARAVIEDDFADGFARFPDDEHWLPTMVMLSEVCVHLDRVESAARLSSNLSPWHGLFATAGAATTQGPVALHLGNLAVLLGHYDEANKHFAESLDVSQRLDSPYWIARTQIAQARLIREANPAEADGAASLLANALDTARRHDFGALAEQVEMLNQG